MDMTPITLDFGQLGQYEAVYDADLDDNRFQFDFNRSRLYVFVKRDEADIHELKGKMPKYIKLAKDLGQTDRIRKEGTILIPMSDMSNIIRHKMDSMVEGILLDKAIGCKKASGD